MTTILIGLAIFAALVLLLAFSMAKVSARADKRASKAHIDLMMKYRYKGGDLKPCRICGELVTPAFSDDFGPVHVRCREEEMKA